LSAWYHDNTWCDKSWEMSRNHLFVRANLSFDHAVFIQYFLTCNLSICITFLIQITDPATAQRPRRAIGSQCHARGEKSDIVCVGQQHRRSGYLIDTGYGCHVLHAGSTPVCWWPFTIEYVHSHASETQDEAKAPQYDPKAFRKWNF